MARPRHDSKTAAIQLLFPDYDPQAGSATCPIHGHFIVQRTRADRLGAAYACLHCHPLKNRVPFLTDEITHQRLKESVHNQPVTRYTYSEVSLTHALARCERCTATFKVAVRHHLNGGSGCHTCYPPRRTPK